MPEPKTPGIPTKVLKSQTGDIHQVRCPYCKIGLATHVNGPGGSKILRCGGCGRQLTSRQI